MRIEEMEKVLADFVVRHSSALDKPLRQRIHLVKENVGLKVGQEDIEISVHLILEGVSLTEMVERLIDLDQQLFTKAREEKRRKIEQEKILARAHILELKRLCTTEEFTSYMKPFLNGRLTRIPDSEMPSSFPTD